MLNVIKWLFEMFNAKNFRILDVNALSNSYNIFSFPASSATLSSNSHSLSLSLSSWHDASFLLAMGMTSSLFLLAIFTFSSFFCFSHPNTKTHFLLFPNWIESKLTTVKLVRYSFPIGQCQCQIWQNQHPWFNTKIAFNTKCKTTTPLDVWALRNLALY